MTLAVAGFDPGTSTGWAVQTADGVKHCGTWRLPPPDAGAMRLDELERRLSSLRSRLPFDQVAFERPYWSPQRPQIADLLVKFVGVIELWSWRQSLPLHGYEPGVVKRAFGHGNLDKDGMIKIATLLGWVVDNSDHAADAAACVTRLLSEQLPLALLGGQGRRPRRPLRVAVGP